VLQQTDAILKIAYQTVNTGRQDLEFGKENTESMEKMVVRFDPFFENGKMEPHLSDIIASLKQQEFAVVAGKIGSRRVMEVRLSTPNSGAAPAPSETMAELSSPTPSTPIAEPTLPEQPVVEKIETETKIETVVTEIETETKTETKIETETEIETEIETETETAVTENTVKDESLYYDPESCPDLQIESIKVVKQKKNYVIIEYTIKNTGKGPAHIDGTSKSEDDNIAVKAFMTSSSKLTKGALVLGGNVLKSRSKKPTPLLPSESYTTKIRLDINSMTKFTPVIILELDTFGQVRECDETNNKNYVKVR